ncbi:helix-turn-helix domain-containing protein [Candidatus Micrarchaeota archaeon]|nr:helix-turn-helix domain-containing protein [Candidatus Micrarchaeota archaeon]
MTEPEKLAGRMKIAGPHHNLVLKAKAGDAEAIAKLVKIYKPYAYQISRKFFIPGMDREDLLQEAFSAIVLAIKKYNPGIRLVL